jgi:hypothetical protein
MGHAAVPPIWPVTDRFDGSRTSGAGLKGIVNDDV